MKKKAKKARPKKKKARPKARKVKAEPKAVKPKVKPVEHKMFKLDHGPWTKIFEGLFQDLDIEIYSNPEKLLLVIIYDVEKGQLKGAVVQLHYPFLAKGSIEAFVDALPENVLVLAKRAEKTTTKFLMASTEPVYLNWQEEVFQKGFAELLVEIKRSADSLLEHSKGFEAKLTKLSQAPKAVQSEFFTEPVLLPGLAARMPAEVPVPALEEVKVIPRELMLGLTKEGKLAEESIDSFKTTLVTDGESINRMHVLHVLAEGSLLAHLALTIFDWGDDFNGLSAPTKKLENLRKAKIEIEPIGFPVKHFYAGKDVKVDLNLINPRGLMQLIGVKEKKLNDLVTEKMTEKKISSLKELIKALKQVKPTEKLNQYEINKAVRVIQLIESKYPQLFNADNPIEEISKLWVKTIGRAGIIHLGQLPNHKSKLMVLHCVLKGILAHYKEKGISRKLKAMVLLPKAEELLNAQMEYILSIEATDFFSQFQKYGVGFTLETKHALDLHPDLVKAAKGHLTLVKDLDSAVKLEGKKGYRVRIRPTLSTSVKGE